MKLIHWQVENLQSTVHEAKSEGMRKTVISSENPTPLDRSASTRE